jgi:hypothetical protein
MCPLILTVGLTLSLTTLAVFLGGIFSRRCFEKWSIPGLLANLSFFLASGGTLWAGAQADFTDGGAIEQSATKTGVEVSTSVDAVPGCPGNGWRTPWSVMANSGSMRKVEVSDVNPINGAGKHLSFEFSTVHKFPHRQMDIVRGYDGTVLPKTFAFDLRLDDTSLFKKENTFFAVAYEARFKSIPMEDFSQSIFPLDPNMLWAIRCQAGSPNWWVYSGARDTDFDPSKFVDSGFPAVVGDVYHFEIKMDSDALTWSVKINNLTKKTNYDSKDLKLSGPSGADLKASYISFGGGNVDGPAPDALLKFSLDTLVVN